MAMICAFAGMGQGAEDYCGYDPEVDGSVIAPLGRDGVLELTAKIVFVDFIDPVEIDVPNAFYEATHGTILAEMDTLLYEQSQGMVRFSDQSGYLFPSNQAWTYPDQALTTWEAQLPAIQYNNDTDNPLPPTYVPEWESRVGSWWTNPEHYATHLFAEILWKIRVNYDQLDILFSEPVDYVFFIFNSKNSPYYNEHIGGRPSVDVNVAAVKATEEIGSFYDNWLVIPGAGGRFVGTGQRDVAVNNMIMKTMHELGHSLCDFGEGPPNIGDLENIRDERRYYYGNLNAMSQHNVEGELAPIYGTHWLERTEWFDVVDFTGDNLKNQKIYDLRIFDDPQDGVDPNHPKGKIFKFRDTETGQYFLMAYHAGIGVDARTAVPGGSPVIRSKGLEIYHCVAIDQTPLSVDLESAFGLWYNIMSPDMPADLEAPPGIEWGIPILDWSVGEIGFDNYDLWYLGDEPIQYRSDAYGDYTGDDFDFFRIDLPSNGGTPSPWNKDEFSPHSNPNCFWYDESSFSSSFDGDWDWYRRLPQTVGNAMVVHIKEQNNDYDPDNGEYPYMIVDLLSSPYEEVSLAPPPLTQEEYVPGIPVTVSWSQYYVDLLDYVDFYFSTNEGQSYELVATGIDPLGPFAWTPTADDATQHGKFKAVFHNIHNDHVCDFVYPDDWDEPFDLVRVAGAIEVFETLVAPNGGEFFFAHNEVSIEWTSFFNENPSGHGEDYNVVIDSVDLDFFDGASWEQIAGGLQLDQVGGYEYIDSRGVNRYLWTPTNDEATADGRIRLTVNYTRGESAQSVSDESDDTFQICPLASRFADRTIEVRLDHDPDEIPPHEGYLGTPASAIALDYNDDQAQDLFVALASDDTSDDRSRLYENLVTHFAESFVFAFGNVPSASAHGVIAADFNNDTYIDLFMGHDTEPRLYEYNEVSNEFEDVKDDLPDLLKSHLALTQRAAWIDWNHDGTLDLWLGRSTFIPTGGGKGSWDPESDFLLINEGDDLGTWTEFRGGLSLEVTTSLCACDFDRDGFNEIVFSYNSPDDSPTVKMYKEPLQGNLVEVVCPIVDSAIQQVVIGLEWVDYDNDGWLDLFTACAVGESYLFLNDGAGGFDESLALSVDGCAGAEVLDFNQDGHLDFFFNAATAGEMPTLLMNCGGIEYITEPFIDVSLPVGLTADMSGGIGPLAADFDGDGFPDLFTGRTENPGRFLKSIAPGDPQSNPTGNWVGIQLESENGWNNRSGIGAVVEVVDSAGRSQWKLVDGGSGQGNQNALVLNFGLGDASGDVTYTVHWPNFYTQTGTLAPGAYHTISDGTVFDDIGIHNVGVSAEIMPDLQQNIEFTWKTNLRCPSSGVRVVIEPDRNRPAICSPGAAWFEPGSTGTSYAMVLDPDGSFLHTLTVLDVPCSFGCSFDFHVESGIGSYVAESSIETYDHETCGVSVSLPPGD